MFKFKFIKDLTFSRIIPRKVLFYEYYIFYDEEIDPEVYFDESTEEIGSIMFSETLFVEKEADLYKPRKISSLFS